MNDEMLDTDPGSAQSKSQAIYNIGRVCENPGIKMPLTP